MAGYLPEESDGMSQITIKRDILDKLPPGVEHHDLGGLVVRHQKVPKIIQEKTKRFLKVTHSVTVVSMGGLSSKNNSSKLKTIVLDTLNPENYCVGYP